MGARRHDGANNQKFVLTTFQESVKYPFSVMIDTASSSARIYRLETIGILLGRTPGCDSIAAEVHKTVRELRKRWEQLDREVDEVINRLQGEYGS